MAAYRRYRDTSPVALECVPVSLGPAGLLGPGRWPCPVCRSTLTVHQPDDSLPDRLLATCGDSKAWYLIALDAGLALLLPDASARLDL